MASIKHKLKVFGVLNHLSNQYEQLKLAEHYDVEFTWLINNVRKWNRYSPRPMPKYLKWVTHYEPGKYDVAILHLDQQAADPLIGKGQLYRQLNEVIQDIPKIVINHGTPMWDEQFTEELVVDGGVVQSSKGPREIDGIKKIVGDNFMIVNSYEAVKRWGWGYPLIHGMDADEWWDLPKEPRATVMVSPGGLDKYYNRQLLTYIKARVKELTGLDVYHITVNYKCQDWDDYRQFIGKSLIYINPTLDSPMPRSRTEAMLSGCCVLTSRYHGAKEFIEHGKEGFIVPDNPLLYAQTVAELIDSHYQEAVEIGQAGKKKALKLFNGDRYRKDLYNIITQVASGKPPVWNGEKVWGSAND